MGNYEPYFKVMKQVSAERGAKYSFGCNWASVDSTRDGERVVVEAGFNTGEDGTYFVGEVFEYEDTSNDAIDTLERVDGVMGATTAELMRFVEKWV